MEKGRPREWWIHKGRSCFADEMALDQDELFYEVKHKPDGFYDLISPKDTIEGGIHVREVLILTDDEKRRVEEAKQIMTMYKDSEESKFIDVGNVYFAATTFQDLLERAGVINE